MEFKVGDIVRLKNYYNHSDWRDHFDQEAEVISITYTAPTTMLNFATYETYKVLLRWRDGRESSSPKNNLILVKNSNKTIKMSLLKKLLSPEDRLLSKYVFTECGDLNMNSELVQEALLKTKGFRDALLLIVKDHDKKEKRKKKCDE